MGGGRGGLKDKRRGKEKEKIRGGRDGKHLGLFIIIDQPISETSLISYHRQFLFQKYNLKFFSASSNKC